MLYMVASKPLASRPSPPNVAHNPPRACCMQDMAPFNMLMLWADLLPPLYMTSILDVEFFPKWLTVLHRWLSNTADYAEVRARMHRGWFVGVPWLVLWAQSDCYGVQYVLIPQRQLPVA